MWMLLLLITFWCVLSYAANHQRQSLMIMTFLATGAYQLEPIHCFWSSFLLEKPYDDAYVAMGAMFLLQLIVGKTIINSRGEYFNSYLGFSDIWRYLSTSDFLVLFLNPRGGKTIARLFAGQVGS